MLKIGLKLWSTNDYYIKEAARLFEEGIYEYIELYAIPNSFDVYSQKWEKLKIPYIIHAPHFKDGMNLAKKENFDLNMKLSKEAVLYADKLGAESIIFHPGIGGDIKETARQIKHLGDERIIIENKPYKAIGSDLNCNGYNIEEIDYIIKNCKVGFCLDIGHAVCSANAQNIDPFEYVSNFLELKPKMYHLSDGDINGIRDKHLHFGDGNFDLEKIISILPSNFTLTLETPKNSKTDLNDFVEDVNKIITISVSDINIKLATIADMLDVYSLSNDVEVRKNSFNSEFIELEKHKLWFENKIKSTDCVYYIARNSKGTLLGQVRFDKNEQDTYIVGISVSAEQRGLGLGTKLLKQTSTLFTNSNKDIKIIAYIKHTNESSLKAFIKAGYKVLEDNSNACGVRSYKLIYG